jgi:NAD(P)-dependent dehydrogenase (short-subunit alcohol dehydrogenase family)
VTRLAGQAAIVTGGGSGIGRAVCAALALEGAHVVVADLDEAGARTTEAEVAAAGGDALAEPVDVTSAADVEAVVARTAARQGRIDVLVCCAGICRVRPLLELEEAELLEMWRVHALGTFLAAKAAAARMLERRYGRIVALVSGPGGYGASAWTAHYQSAKSAQTSLARSLALSLAPHGITVNCVSPGLVVTPLWERMDADFRSALGKSAQQEIADRLADRSSHPLGRAVEPDEVARTVVFLCLPGSGALNGEVLNL